MLSVLRTSRITWGMMLLHKIQGILQYQMNPWRNTMSLPDLGWSRNTSPPDEPEEDFDEGLESEEDDDFIEDIDIELAEKDYEAKLHHLK